MCAKHFLLVGEMFGWLGRCPGDWLAGGLMRRGVCETLLYLSVNCGEPLCNCLYFVGVDLGLIFRFTGNSEGSGGLGMVF